MPVDSFAAALADKVEDKKLDALRKKRDMVLGAAKQALSPQDIADVAIASISELRDIPRPRVIAVVKAMIDDATAKPTTPNS